LDEQPLLGAIYMFSPSSVKQRMIGPLTGYAKKDLKPGGRLEQLVGMKKEMFDIFKQRMEAEGYHGERERWIRRAALESAIRNPLRYVASVGVFAYKGMWFLRPGGIVFNVVAVVCFFALFFSALFAGNQLLVAAFGLPAGLFFFVSVFTHALTRYNAPITPFVIISILWLLTTLARRVVQKIGWPEAITKKREGRMNPRNAAAPTMPHTSELARPARPS